MMSEKQLFIFLYRFHLLPSKRFQLEKYPLSSLNSYLTMFINNLAIENQHYDYFSKIFHVNMSFLMFVFIAHKFPSLMCLRFMK